MPSERGLTIIELLIVTAIVGVLVGIALPMYGDYRRRSNDKVAQAVLRNIVTSLEVYFVDNHQYVSCTEEDCGDLLTGMHGIDSRIDLEVTGDEDSFVATASHVNGTGNVFSHSSE